TAGEIFRRRHPQPDRVSGDTEMKHAKTFLLFAAFALAAAFAFPIAFAAGDGLDPARLLKPLGEEWTSYSGDYSGKRYSALTQINQSNVKNVTLAWVRKMSGAPSLTGAASGRRGGGGGGTAAVPTIIGGEGSGDVVVADALSVKGSILQ